VNQLFVVIPEIGWNLARPGARGRLMQNQNSKIKNSRARVEPRPPGCAPKPKANPQSAIRNPQSAIRNSIRLGQARLAMPLGFYYKLAGL
jgi:hypothetical protein